MASMLLLHGFKSSADSYFFPSLRRKYEKNHTVAAPNFPLPDEPEIDKWTDAFTQTCTKDYDLVVAHSLGGAFACSLITRGLLTCKTLILIASSPGPKDDIHMNTFLKYPLSFPEVRKNAKHIFVVQSLDDPWTIPEYGLITLKHTEGTGIFYANKGHLEDPELPEEVVQCIDRALRL